MASKIVLPAVVIVLAIAAASAEKIKCYECYSVGGANDECNGEIMTKSATHKPVECSTGSLYAWHRKIQTVPELSKIVDIFKVGPNPQNDLDVPMACIKINLRVDNQPVVMRTCQTAKTEQVDTCKAITKQITNNYFQHAKVENCTLCDTDSCNGAFGLSPSMMIALVPLLGSLLMSLVHNNA